jgi:hypothetical protein
MNAEKTSFVCFSTSVRSSLLFFSSRELLGIMEQTKPNSHTHNNNNNNNNNITRKTWGKSGDPDAAKRCEVILDRMEDLYFQGRKELCPDTRSFNTVIDALARSRDSGSSRRAEALLERMEELATTHKELADVCHPDVMVRFVGFRVHSNFFLNWFWEHVQKSRS